MSFIKNIYYELIIRESLLKMIVNSDYLPVLNEKHDKDVKLKIPENFFIEDNKSKTKPTVTIYNALNFTYTKFVEYKSDQMLTILLEMEDKIFMICQIDSDDELYQKVIKKHFRSNFEDIHKIFESKLDFCFTPVGGFLCFNISVVSEFYYEKLKKHIIQLLLFKTCIYIINRKGIETIQEIFKTKFKFKYFENNQFFEILNNNRDPNCFENQLVNSLINGFILEEIFINKKVLSSSIEDNELKNMGIMDNVIKNEGNDLGPISKENHHNGNDITL